MPISKEQVTDVEKLRKDVHTLVSKGVDDEYLLATYNGILRRLDMRLPTIRQRTESKGLKEESRKLVKAQRESAKQKRKNAANAGRATSQKAS